MALPELRRKIDPAMRGPLFRVGVRPLCAVPISKDVRNDDDGSTANKQGWQGTGVAHQQARQQNKRI
jgi:hypothetical protein